MFWHKKSCLITFTSVRKCNEYDEPFDSRRISNIRTACKKVSVRRKEQSHKNFTGRSSVSAEHSMLVYWLVTKGDDAPPTSAGTSEYGIESTPSVWTAVTEGAGKLIFIYLCFLCTNLSVAQTFRCITPLCCKQFGRGWGMSKHNCLLSYLLCWRHISATVGHLQVKQSRYRSGAARRVPAS